MIIRDSHIVAAGVTATIAALAVLIVVKWNGDGPNGENLSGKFDEQRATPDELPATALAQRRRERATIAGVVRDEQGAGIAGATVCAAASSTLLSASESQWPRCTTSGADGGYSIEDLFGVRQRVSASAPGFMPSDHVHVQAGVRRRAIDLRPGGEAADIDVTLQRGGVEIRGVVRDLQGAAIADARISSGGADSGTGIVWGRSGPDGAFALWVRPGVVSVVAHAPGHAPGGATGASDGPAFAVVLLPAAVLRGTVVLAADGKPIEGAWVRASADGEVVRTDGAGRFAFESLAPGVYTPRVEADDGFGMAAEQVALGIGETSRPLTISVRPAAFVEGRVVYADGEACDSATLTLRDTASGREVRDTGEHGGLVHVRGLLPGTYTAQVGCVGALASEGEAPVVVGKRDVVDQVWQVVRGRSIAGVLVDADGAPVAGASLVVRSPGLADSPAVISDAAGRFMLRGLGPGAVQVVPVAHAWRTMPDAAVTVQVGEADVADVRVALAATGALRGTLRDAQGTAIAGAELSLRTAHGAQTAMTGLDGGFHVERAAVGASALTASLGGMPLVVRKQPQVTILQGQTTTATLVAAAPTGTITGVVRDADGSLLAGAVIEAWPDGVVWRGPPRTQRSGEAGQFTLAGLAAGAYTLVARRVGGGEARRERVKLGEVATLAIAGRGRVGGKVVLHGGVAPPSFVIDLVDARTGARRGETFVATDGAWGFGGLERGDLEIQLHAREGSLVRRLEFTAGETSGIRLELIGATTLRGTVVDLLGAPVAGLEVASDSVREVGTDGGAITDADGRFELLRLPVGVVSVTVAAPDGRRGLFGPVRFPVVVQPDLKVIALAPVRVAARRLAEGQVRGDLGFTLEAADADPLLAHLQVASVRNGGAAAEAGLRRRDEIVAVDEQDVRGVHRSLYTTLSEVPAGAVVRLGLARGETVALTARAPR